jgi:hypothetical protein
MTARTCTHIRPHAGTLILPSKISPILLQRQRKMAALHAFSASWGADMDGIPVIHLKVLIQQIQEQARLDAEININREVDAAPDLDGEISGPSP